MGKIIIWLIRIYQMIPFSSHIYCRCQPTCSQYMAEAIEYYGWKKGVILGLKRVLNCRPGGIYGYQPLIKNEEE